MTRQASSPGRKPRRAGGNGPTPEREDRVRQVLRAKAARRIGREPDAAHLLTALGLAVDPVAEHRSRAKAAPSPMAPPPMEVGPGCCPLCGHPIPKTGTCRKRLVCRAGAARKEMET